MKNVMIIDGAINCSYDIFQFRDAEFRLIFPKENQDIAFIDEVPEKVLVSTFWDEVWQRRVNKKSVHGIHGLLFYDLDQKKEYYPNRRDSDLDVSGRGN